MLGSRRRLKPVTAAEAGRGGSLYRPTAVFVSCGIALFEFVYWLSIAGHSTLKPLVIRVAAALCFGFWAGGTRGRNQRTWDFLAFALPQILLINSWSILALLATPRDPA